MNIRRFLLLSTGLSLGVLASCIDKFGHPTPGHCANEDGDATCVALDPSKPFCDGCAYVYAGCVAEVPAEERCYFPCGGGQSALDDKSCRSIHQYGC